MRRKKFWKNGKFSVKNFGGKKNATKKILENFRDIFFIFARGNFFLESKSEKNEKFVPEIFAAKKGDLREIVSSDGNIINPDILNLSFFKNGTLAKIYVEEGDKIEKNDLLAELEKKSLNFDLQSAENDVNIALQNIRAKKAEITNLDFIDAQNNFAVTKDKSDTNISAAEQKFITAKKKLESEQSSAQQKFEQTFSDAEISIETAFSEIREILTKVDYIFGITRNYGEKTISYLAFNDSIRENDVKNNFYEMQRNLEKIIAEYEKKISFEDISRVVWRVKNLVEKMENFLNLVVKVFDSAKGHGGISEEKISQNLANIESAQNKIQNLNKNIFSAKKNIDTNFLDLQKTIIDTENNLQSAKLDLENAEKIAENDVKSAELKLKNSEKNLNKLEISKNTSLQIQYAQLEQAKLRVEKAKYELSLADLRAPKSGTIIEINGNAGESIKAESTSSENCFIKILSDANFTTEVFVEEIDIAKIKIGQKAKITLDAIPDADLIGKVNYIASTATTDNNGIVTYLVRIDISDIKNQPVREGMTTFVDFIIEEKNDVLIVPNSAIIKNKFLLRENGEKIPVEIGFSDGEFTEIKSGLKIGEKIIKNPPTQNFSSKKKIGQNFSDERIEKLKSAGFSADEIQKLKSGEITDEMKKKLQKNRENSGGIGGQRMPGMRRK